jgi:hypothetical protein
MPNNGGSKFPGIYTKEAIAPWIGVGSPGTKLQIAKIFSNSRR